MSGLVFISTLIGGRIWSKIITIKYRNATSIEDGRTIELFMDHYGSVPQLDWSLSHPAYLH